MRFLYCSETLSTQFKTILMFFDHSLISLLSFGEIGFEVFVISGFEKWDPCQYFF